MPTDKWGDLLVAYEKAFATYPRPAKTFDDLFWLFTGTFVGEAFVPDEGKMSRGAIRLNHAEGKALFKAVSESTGNILEIGRFFGGSTVLISVAGSGRLLVSVDRAPEHYRVCAAYFERCQPQLLLLTQDSSVPIGARFGCLFIDGDHTFEGVLSDTKTHWPAVDVGGLVVYHDAVRGAYGSHEGVTCVTEALALGYGELIATADSLAVFRKVKELPAEFQGR
jgi:hypothetical protein